jgi:Zn-finger nucleic acid-binding protein
MNCPACNVSLLMTERQGTQIDYCPQCRGIWLEKGKLDRIIERSAAEMPPRTIPQAVPQAIPQGYGAPPVRRDDGHYDKHHDGHDGHDGGYRKKRGFLHDLFD